MCVTLKCYEFLKLILISHRNIYEKSQNYGTFSLLLLDGVKKLVGWMIPAKKGELTHAEQEVRLLLR